MIYTPLDETNNEIRVLKFQDPWHSETSSKPIRLSMETVSLNAESEEYRDFQKCKEGVHCAWRDRFTQEVDLRDQVQDHDTSKSTTSCEPRLPDRFTWGDYEALSYAWGEETPKENILLDGYSREISCNLEAALRVLHRLPETQLGMRYWADQLCINQEDIEERNHQVKRIKNIYSVARAVVVWLGAKTADDERAMRVIKATRRDASRNQWLLPPPNMNAKDWNSICQFLRKPYWQRLWIIQELAANPNATLFLCGELSLTREMIKLAAGCCQKLLRDNVTFTHGSDLDTWSTSSRAYRLVYLNQEIALNEMVRKALNLARQATACDERDKVYGILGLLGESVSSQIIPDYSENNSTQSVFTALTIAIIRAENSLEQIVYGAESLEPGWPSWVPDLRRPFIRCHIKHLRDYCASKKRPPRYHILNDQNIMGTCLRVKGIEVDLIDGIAASPFLDDSPIYPSHQPRRYKTDDIPILGRTLVMDHPKTHKHPALMNLPWNVTRQRFLSLNHESASTYVLEDQVFEDFQQFRERNHDFRINGRLLRDYFPAEVRKNKKPHVLLYHMRLAVISLKGRKLATTETGYMCLVPEAVRKGDVLVVLYGCNFPVLLRPLGKAYQVLGECFVPGLMNGEVFGAQIEEGLKTRDFILA